jgi:hypothetical protein
MAVYGGGEWSAGPSGVTTHSSVWLYNHEQKDWMVRGIAIVYLLTNMTSSTLEYMFVAVMIAIPLDSWVIISEWSITVR